MVHALFLHIKRVISGVHSNDSPATKNWQQKILIQWWLISEIVSLQRTWPMILLKRCANRWRRTWKARSWVPSPRPRLWWKRLTNCRKKNILCRVLLSLGWCIPSSSFIDGCCACILFVYMMPFFFPDFFFFCSSSSYVVIIFFFCLKFWKKKVFGRSIDSHCYSTKAN